MPKIIDGVEYLNTSEAIKMVGGSRQSFYKNVKPYLRLHHFASKKTPMYSSADVIAVATGKPNRKGTIPIKGMFANWSGYAQSLGHNVITETREVKVVTLPEDLAKTFDVTTDQIFVKRGRMTIIDGSPVCYWDTYYPIEYVGDILPQIQQGTASNIVEHMKEKYGVVVGKVKDRYSTRITTLDELNLFRLLNDEPVLIVQRVAWTSDQKILALSSDMVLLGSWFVIEREEEVHNWDG